MGRDEWTSVLKLSTLWGFRELRQRALDALVQMPIHPADKVVLAREYDVERWLVDGYMELVKRDTGLSSEEKKKLGYESSLRVYEKREDTFRRGLQFQQSQYLSGYSIVNGSRVFDNLEAEIRGVFGRSYHMFGTMKFQMHHPLDKKSRGSSVCVPVGIKAWLMM